MVEPEMGGGGDGALGMLAHSNKFTIQQARPPTPFRGRLTSRVSSKGTIHPDGMLECCSAQVRPYMKRELN
jgi:hypothetical protein